MLAAHIAERADGRDGSDTHWSNFGPKRRTAVYDDLESD